MKIVALSISFFLFFSFLMVQPNCKKIKVKSATVQKTMPGFKGADVKENYTFILQKSKKNPVEIQKVWIKSAKKGKFIAFKIFKYQKGKIIYEEISTMASEKKVAIVAIDKYPMEKSREEDIAEKEICPIANFSGKAILQYSLNNETKYLEITTLTTLKTITKR